MVYLLDSVRPLCSALNSSAALYCAELWPLCASAADCHAVKGHPLVKEAGDAVRRASAGMKDGTNSVRGLRNVLAVPEERVAAAFSGAGCGGSEGDFWYAAEWSHLHLRTPLCSVYLAFVDNNHSGSRSAGVLSCICVRKYLLEKERRGCTESRAILLASLVKNGLYTPVYLQNVFEKRVEDI